jgi:hypothetical protein
VDPEGNGVIMSEGAEGGPGPPSRDEDKQSVYGSGADKTSMGVPEEQQDELSATSRPRYAQSMYHCMHHPIVNLDNCNRE